LEQRTYLDTGAWATGVLSVGVFDPDQRGGPLEILSVRVREAGQIRALSDRF
jgi:hypothetical protein